MQFSCWPSYRPQHASAKTKTLTVNRSGQRPRKRPIEVRFLHTKRTTENTSGTDCYREALQNDLAAKAQKELLDRQDAKGEAEREAAERLKRLELEIEMTKLEVEVKQQEQEQQHASVEKVAPPKVACRPDKREVSHSSNESDAVSQCSGTSSSRRRYKKTGPKLPSAFR